jgi:CBS domain containing-hemolysin-like protein
VEKAGEGLPGWLPRDKGDTVGGLRYSLLGAAPVSRQAVHWMTSPFIVETMEGRRIAWLLGSGAGFPMRIQADSHESTPVR